MRLGQTSIIYFLSRFSASILGFVATIYFARLLGAEPLGIYYLTIAFVSWLSIVAKIGVSGAITKRVSESKDKEQYAAAGAISIAILFTVILTGTLFFRSYINSYVGHPATKYILLILLVTLCYSIISSLLAGLHLVHIKGILSPIETGSRSLLQIGALIFGMGLSGLFLGYITGYILVLLIGSVVVNRHLQGITLPEKRHFLRLFDYAKFSWLGSLQSRMFNYTDVILLGFFVPSALIGIYSIAWNVSQFLILFAGAISTTFFPEMSEVSMERNPQAVANLVEDSLSYAGLLLIPGLIGGVIIGERLLRIYGQEFARGATILTILIAANLVMSYQYQILNTLNAIDRPDLSFRVNALFVVANIALNVVLIYFFGWIGAAIATTLSVTISLLLAYYYLDTIVNFTIPFLEITRQWIAAIVMGAIIYGALWIENTHRLLAHNFAVVTIVVSIGASVYFITLFVLSSSFRTTVLNNLPIDVPFTHN